MDNLPDNPSGAPQHRNGVLRTLMRARNVQMGLGLVVFSIAIALLAFAAWITHVVWVIGKLAGDAGITFGQVALAVLGTLVPPIGVLHGIMIWFGLGF